MGRHMIPDEYHDEMMAIAQRIPIMENIGHTFNGGESVSQQITRLLGTDDWSLNYGGKFIVGADLDELEKRDGRVE